jgi:hypothetical protein
MSVGSKQQDIHRFLLSELPIPLPSQQDRHEIETLVREAFRSRHHASMLEKEEVNIIASNINSA